MFWIVQNNLYNEYSYFALMDNLVKYNIPHITVKPVPIVNKLVPANFDTFAFAGNVDDMPEVEVDDNQLIFVCGALTLSKIAKQRGWLPGAFTNDDFRYEKWKEHYGENLLNFDAKVCHFNEVDNTWNEFFIRPCEDSKSFTGTVTTYSDYEKWIDNLDLDNEYSTLSPTTMVSYCSLKEIYKEIRFFVIDGKIVTASQYKLGDRVIHSTIIDQYLIDFAQNMINIWQPDRGFVIDIADTPDGPKVIEINCLNSAGFYACDVSKIIGAVENMDF